MKYQNIVARLGLILGAMLFVFAEISAAQNKLPSAGMVTFTVTAVGKKDANASTITMDDVQKPLGKPSDYKFRAPESLEEMKAKLGF